MHTAAPHPSGLPNAPWRHRTGDGLDDTVESADAVMAGMSIASTFGSGGEDYRIAAAVAVLPDLAASAAKLVAAYEAWMATVKGSAEDRAALDRWDEIAAVETGVIGALLKHAGIPIPGGAAVETRVTGAPFDEAIFRPGCTA